MPRLPLVASTLLACAAGSFAAAAQAADTPSAWPMYAMQPGHNAVLASHFPGVHWTFDTPGAAAARAAVKNNTTIRDLVGFPIGVAVAGGAVYAPNDNGYLYRIDARSGKLQWSFDAYNQLMGTPVVTHAGGRELVFVGAGNSVFAYSHAKRFGVHGAGVIRGTDVSAFDAVDAATGKLVWSYPTPGEDMPTPVLAHGLLIFGNGDGHVYALDAATGKLEWKTGIGSFVSMSSAAYDPVRNVVMMGGTHPSDIYAVDAANGKRLWTVHPAHVYSSSAGDGTWAVAGKLVVGQIETRHAGQTTTSGSEEIGIDIATGKVAWSTLLGTGKTPPRNKDAVPAVDAGIVYTGSPVTHTEYAIDASSGKVVWKTRLGPGMKAAPTIVGDRVIQPTGSGKIFTLDRSHGAITHVYDAHQGGYGPQNGVAIGGTLFIGTNTGYLQAIPLHDLGVAG